MNGYDVGSGGGPAPGVSPEVPVQAAEPAPELSAAAQRFQMCRWRKAAENGSPEHCAHRDVHPITGATGFNAESWCPDCAHYKLRRNPRRRPQPSSDDRYYY